MKRNNLRKVGRPRVKSKKKPYQVMLDPRYASYFVSFARSQKMATQDLFRLALTASVPDPFNPLLATPEEIATLREKALAYPPRRARARNPASNNQEGVAKDRRP